MSQKPTGTSSATTCTTRKHHAGGEKAGRLRDARAVQRRCCRLDRINAGEVALKTEPDYEERRRPLLVIPAVRLRCAPERSPCIRRGTSRAGPTPLPTLSDRLKAAFMLNDVSVVARLAALFQRKTNNCQGLRLIRWSSHPCIDRRGRHLVWIVAGTDSGYGQEFSKDETRMPYIWPHQSQLRSATSR